MGDDLAMTRRQIRSLLVALITICVAWFLQRQNLPELSDQVSSVDPNRSTSSTPSHVSTSTEPRVFTNAQVKKVVDGDTIEVVFDNASSSAKIRLLGINTPESVDPRRPVECFGKEASRFLQGIIDAKRIRLEEDLQADDRDKYGRLLRNVVLEDGTDVNALLVKEGYAHAYLSFPLNKQRKNELARLQEEARVAKRGLWNPETCDGMK